MKTLAIVGSHPATRDNAPWDNHSIDIWVFNEAAREAWVKRWDAVFQLHKPTIYRNPNNRTDPKHWEWLQQIHGKPVYMQAHDPLVPNSIIYPLESICKEFLPNFKRETDGGLEHLRYFTNTISYAIALGIFRGYKRIMVYGSEMQSNTEYSYQRDNVAFWVGVALGRGVHVEIHSAYNLFDQPLYGFDGDLTYTPELFSERIALYKADIAQAQAKLDASEIALQAIDPLDKVRMGELMKAAFDAQASLGAIEGAISQLEAYAQKAAVMIAEAGDAIISRQEFEYNAAMANKGLEEHRTTITRMDGQLQIYYETFLQLKNQNALMQFASLAAAQHKVARQMGFEHGRAVENTYWMHYADQKLRAAGGAKSLAAYQEQLITA